MARNRLRRRLRSVVADLARQGRVVPGCYLIGATPAAAGLSFGALADAVADALGAVSRLEVSP